MSVEREVRLPDFFADEGENTRPLWRVFEERSLPGPDDPPDRLNQFVRIVADTVFEHGLDILDIPNFLGRIALNYHQIRLFAGRDCPDALKFSEILRSVVGRDVNRLHWREPCLDQQLHFPL